MVCPRLGQHARRLRSERRRAVGQRELRETGLHHSALRPGPLSRPTSPSRRSRCTTVVGHLLGLRARRLRSERRRGLGQRELRETGLRSCALRPGPLSRPTPPSRSSRRTMVCPRLGLRTRLKIRTQCLRQDPRDRCASLRSGQQRAGGQRGRREKRLLSRAPRPGLLGRPTASSRCSRCTATSPRLGSETRLPARTSCDPQDH